MSKPRQGNEGYADYIGLAERALDLLVHHVEQAHAYSTNLPYARAKRDEYLLRSLLPALAQLRSVIVEINSDLNTEE